MSNKREQFLKLSPENNTDWAAQQILINFSTKQFLELHACFSKLDETLYKRWANEMTFSELKEAVKTVAKINNVE